MKFYIFFLILLGSLFAFSSTGGSYSQDIKVDNLAMNASGGDYTQRISFGIELVGTSDINETRFGILDFVNHPPNVTVLVSPLNATISSSKTVTFSFNVTDDFSLNNCSLWTDESGTFNQTQNNESEMSISETNNITYTFTSDGTYLWNIKCFDSRLDVQQVYSDVYDSNYTITIASSDDSPETSSDQDSSSSIKPLKIIATKNCPENLLTTNAQSSGDGVYGVNIKLIFSDNTFELKQEKTTDEDGTVVFNLTDEIDGKYYIEATRTGYLKSENYFEFYHCGVNQTNQTILINQTEPVGGDGNVIVDDDIIIEPTSPEPSITPTEPTNPPSQPPPQNDSNSNDNKPPEPIVKPVQETGIEVVFGIFILLIAIASIYYFFIHKK
ncbi:MAG: hypothetical protein ABID61_05960 [Candidatus Micrarchaeota archaeon]